MPIFVCDECNCMENTALGHYWTRTIADFDEKSKNGKALCSECTPTLYKDGSNTGGGKWHGNFLKREWDGERKVINR